MQNELFLLNFIAAVKAKNCPNGVKVHFPDGMSRREAGLLSDTLQNPNCPQAITVEIKEKQFTAEQIQILANTLKSGRCPSKLDLIFTTLPDKYKHNGHARTRRHPFIREGLTILAKALASGRCPRGLSIRLQNCYLGCEYYLDDNTHYHTSFSIQALTKPLKSGQCPPGLTLDLSQNNLSLSNIKALADALQSGNCPPGLTLVLDNCALDSQKLEPLVQALKSGRCPRWLTLSLKKNNFQSAGCDVLSEALESGRCPLGLKLNLADNGIDAKGIRAFSLALTLDKCPEKLTLDLSKNPFGTEGYQALAVALKSGLCPRGFTVHLENTPPPNNLAEFRNAIQPQFAPPELMLTGVDDQTAQRVAASNAAHKAATQEIFTFLCALKQNKIAMPKDVLGTIAKFVYPAPIEANNNSGKGYLANLAKRHPNTRPIPVYTVDLISMQTSIKTLVGKYQKLPLIFHRKRATELVKRAEGCNSTLALRTLLKNEEQRFFSNGRGFWSRFHRLEAPLKNRIKLSWGYFGTLQKAIEEADKIQGPSKLCIT